MSDDDRAIEGNRGTRGEQRAARTQPSEEQTWANANPAGDFHIDRPVARTRTRAQVYPSVSLWNFDISEVELKSEHLNFLSSFEFLQFLELRVANQEVFGIAGYASDSGNTADNLVFSAGRAIALQTALFNHDMIRQNPEYRQYFLGAFAEGMQATNRNFSRGMSAAINRSAKITWGPPRCVTPLAIERIRPIVQTYVQRALGVRSLGFDAYDDLWVPTAELFNRISPTTGSNKLDEEHAAFTGGTSAIDRHLGARLQEHGYARLRDFSRICTEEEIPAAIESFFSRARGAKRTQDHWENELARRLAIGAGAGGNSALRGARNNYVRFVKANIDQQLGCLFHRNLGFR